MEHVRVPIIQDRVQLIIEFTAYPSQDWFYRILLLNKEQHRDLNYLCIVLSRVLSHQSNLAVSALPMASQHIVALKLFFFNYQQNYDLHIEVFESNFHRNLLLQISHAVPEKANLGHMRLYYLMMIIHYWIVNLVSMIVDLIIMVGRSEDALIQLYCLVFWIIVILVNFYFGASVNAILE